MAGQQFSSELTEVKAVFRCCSMIAKISSLTEDKVESRWRFKMTVNVGMVDRAVRIVIGAVLIAFAIPLGFPSVGWNWVGWIGIVPIITAIAGYCPAYSIFGFSSCSAQTH